MFSPVSHLRLRVDLRQALVVISCLLLILVSGKPCTFTDLPNGVCANCNSRRLTKLPSYLPAGVYSLDLSINNLTSLVWLSDVRLANLIRLDLSHNSISTVHNDEFRGLSQLQELDLSVNGLLTLPQHAFRGLVSLTSLALRHTGLHELPDMLLTHVPLLVTLDLSGNVLSAIPTAALSHTPGLTSLDLGYNNLTTVADHSLAELNQLRTLNLQFNRLSTLQPAAFTGLGQLLDLDLSNNRLQLDRQHYPPGVFSPLTALQSLYLHGNDDRSYGDYPMNVFTMGTLKTLKIDTFRESQFGPAFAQLTSLTTLRLDDNCKINSLTNSTFAAFKNSSLATLVIARCAVVFIDTCTFCSLPRLNALVLTNIAIGPDVFTSLLLSMYGLQNQNMSLLDLSENHFRNYHPPLLVKNNTKYINNICVRSLYIAKCDIVGIASDAFRANTVLSTCLQYLDLSNNILVELPMSTLLTFSITFRNLVSVLFRNQMIFERRRVEMSSEDRLTQNPGYYDRHGPDVTWIVTLPPALETFDLSASLNLLGDLPTHTHFSNGAQLTFLDISYCGIYSCRTSITGLTSLHTLDLSGNECHVFSDDIFDHLTTLRHLRLRDLVLDQQYVLEHTTRLLRPLVLLEHLDLSYNDLRLLPPDMLHTQSHLQSLVLAGNRFQSIPVDLNQHTNLSLLDLTNNMLTTLLPHERRLLDALVAHNHTVHVHLRQNQLTCACAALDFVLWLSRTVVRLDGRIYNPGYDDDYDDNGRDYPCVLDDGSVSSTGTVMAEWDEHWRRCVGQTVFWAALVGLLLQLLGLVLTFVISRNWTYVCYAWRVLRHLPLPRRLTFRNDVILGHADRDLELAMRVKDTLRNRHDVRVLLPYTAIFPGENWAESILKHVDDSWKIVLLVTRNFLQDHWAGFLVHHAQRSITDIMPDRVLIVFLEQPAQLLAPGPHHPDPARASLQHLLRLVPDRNVFHVHRDAAPRHPVWGRLAQLILQE